MSIEFSMMTTTRPSIGRNVMGVCYSHPDHKDGEIITFGPIIDLDKLGDNSYSVEDPNGNIAKVLVQSPRLIKTKPERKIIRPNWRK